MPLLPNITDQDLGFALKKWRESGLGLRANQLAEKAELSPGYLSDIEKGRRRLNDPTAEKIAAVCGLSVQEFEEELRRELAKGSTLRDEPSSSRFSIPHHGSGEPFPRMTTAEEFVPGSLELARWFVNQLGSEEAVNLATKFMTDYKGGDDDALIRANAILWILSTKTGQPGPR